MTWFAAGTGQIDLSAVCKYTHDLPLIYSIVLIKHCFDQSTCFFDLFYLCLCQWHKNLKLPLFDLICIIVFLSVIDDCHSVHRSKTQ